MSEVERIVLSRAADSHRVDFSEQALEGVDRLTLEDSATEAVVNEASKEFMARVQKVQVEGGRDFEVAFRYVRDTCPRLFKICRLEKTRGRNAVLVAAEEDETR